MNPNQLDLPFFSYGLFRPGQIGYSQLRPYVSSHEDSWHVKGMLRERDGLPLLDDGTGEVTGVLIHFKEEMTQQGYEVINSIEPKKLYRWKVDEVRRAGETVKANLLFGLKPKKGSHVFEEQEWDSKKEPLFSSALDVVKEVLEQNRIFGRELKPLFRLQMAYSLLWSAIERFTAFKYHLGENATKKVEQLATEPAFASNLPILIKEPRVVYRTDNPDDKITLDPNDPGKAVNYYYQVRSNIAHRGKAAIRDHEILVQSLEELLELFQRVLQAEFSPTEE